MFWSKIWLFLIGTAAALAIGVALTTPKPASRKLLDSQDEHLERAGRGVEALLRENARQRVDLAMFLARLPAPEGTPRLKLDAALDEASKAERISQDLHDTARATLDYVLTHHLSAAGRPEFVAALDSSGRVVARLLAGNEAEEKEWGDTLSGYYLVRDALRGYMRDDLWLMGGKLYLVAGSPVIANNDKYVGVIVIGKEVDFPMAKALEQRVSSRCGKPAADGSRPCDTQVAFFARGNVVATSESTPLTEDIKAEYDKRKPELDKRDDKGRWAQAAAFTVAARDKSYGVALRRLPGEAGQQDGFFAVYSRRPEAAGFIGTLKGVTRDDLPMSSAIALGIGFLLIVVAGMALVWWEGDRPLKRLVEDAIAVGKGDRAKLDEEHHRGKFGSIARSINIALDKLAREAKGPRRDLGALVDEGGARALPQSPPGGGFGGSFAPPPPSDFALGGEVPRQVVPHGGGFEFEMPPPPPPQSFAPPPPPLEGRKRVERSGFDAALPPLPPVNVMPGPPATSPDAIARAPTMTWCTISAVDMLRCRPPWPVAQNGHAMPHPACEEMQIVARSR